MKVKQLCHEVKFNHVFYALQYMYHVPTSDKLGYLRAFRKMRNSDKVEGEIITVHVDKNTDYQHMYDVYGLSTHSKNKLILHYSNIEEWSNYYVVNHNYTAIKFMAHILFEACYKGFTNEEIQDKYIKFIYGRKRKW